MSDRQLAAKWAYDLLQRNDWCVIDTETTGLSGDAEIVQLAVVGADESVLLQTLVKPTVPIDPKAAAVHGITEQALLNAPRFDAVLVPLLQAVGHRDVLIYNAEFDLRLIRQSVKPYGMQLAFPTSDRRQCRVFLNGGSIHCAMLWYSQYVGERKGMSYKWQKLPSGDHSAVGDCKAVIKVIKDMAEAWKPEAEELLESITF